MERYFRTKQESKMTKFSELFGLLGLVIVVGFILRVFYAIGKKFVLKSTLILLGILSHICFLIHLFCKIGNFWDDFYRPKMLQLLDHWKISIYM